MGKKERQNRQTPDSGEPTRSDGEFGYLFTTDTSGLSPIERMHSLLKAQRVGKEIYRASSEHGPQFPQGDDTQQKLREILGGLPKE